MTSIPHAISKTPAALRGGAGQAVPQQQVIDHNHYIGRYGEDMPEVRDWK
jgi:hypothetical protein